MKQRKIMVGIFLIASVCLFSLARGVTRIKAETAPESSTISQEKIATSSSSEGETVEQSQAEKKQTDESKTEQVTSDTNKTESSKAARSQIAPLAENTVIVKNWAELAQNYNDASVTSIQFGNDIAYGTGGTTALRNRTTSISIDGNGFNLNMGSQLFNVTQSSTATFNLSNIPVVTSTMGSTVYGLVHASDANTALSGWTINIADINSATTNVIRIASVSGAQLNLAGNIKWYTRSEMAVIDGVRIEDNAKVIGLKQQTGSDNRSFFWFPQSSMSANSAGSHNFEVGKNASANFKMTNGGTAYPVVFAYYNTLHLEDGATFNGTMPGNAFRADYANSSFIADGNNKINFTSLSSGNAPVRFQNTSSSASQFYVGPDSEAYIIAATNTPLFDASNNTIAGRTSIIFDSPKNYDLRNYSTSNTAAASSISNSAFKEFSIKNSDINVWKLTDNVNAPATYAGSKVDYLTQTGASTVTSSDTNLLSLFPFSKVRRVSGLNQNPELSFIDVTNAQKAINFQTILGYVPDENGIDENGNINYIPVYPTAGQAKADVTDTYGTKYTGVASGTNGQTTIDTGKLNQAGLNVSGFAYNGNRTQEEPAVYKVWDVVPPDPAVVTSTDLTEGTSTLEGTGEAGATVYLNINGTRIDAATSTVSADGKWKVTFDPTLAKVGSVATIYLEDTAGKATIANPPSTNNEKGNINPTNDLTYQDVTFKAATKITFVKSNFAITANDFSLNAKNYPKTNDELKALIRSESNATLTNLDTQEVLPASNIEVDTSNLPDVSSSDIAKGEYTVTLSYTRGESTFTKTITVKITKVTIVDPEDGVTPFTPENQSTGEIADQNQSTDDLRIQYVSNFDFGENTRDLIQSNTLLSKVDYGSTESGQTKNVPSFVSINDDRKAPTGWDLSVSTNDFVNKATNTTLKGAYMTLSNFKYNGSAEQKPDVVNKNVEISSTPSLVSSSDTGLYGSWSLALGDVTSGDKSSGVNLTVPKNSARSLGEYQTEIVWTLTPKI